MKKAGHLEKDYESNDHDMNPDEGQRLKQLVRGYWNREACGTGITKAEKNSKAYFDEVESYRYSMEPEILEFANFSQSRGLRVLEIGVGAGTDFARWADHGAEVTGIDLTEEAILTARSRLDLSDLEADLLQADCEELPFKDNAFDTIYSWGVLHHTADTWRAVDEAMRVCKASGTCRIMLYHFHSVATLRTWLRFCLLRGEPQRSLSWALWNHMESPGTKAYSRKDVYHELSSRGAVDLTIRTPSTCYDMPQPGSPFSSRLLTRFAMIVAGGLRWRSPGWFLMIEFKKPL